MTGNGDALADALDTVADAAEESAQDQRDAAGAARGLAQERRSGRSATDAELTDQVRSLLSRLGASARRVAGAVTSLRSGWIRSMLAEGRSIRQAAQLLGVSHQRVSAVVRGRAAPRGSSDG